MSGWVCFGLFYRADFSIFIVPVGKLQFTIPHTYEKNQKKSSVFVQRRKTTRYNLRHTLPLALVFSPKLAYMYTY